MLETRHRLMNSDFPALKREQLQTLQVNLGYLCNLSCVHCHVNAGPSRTEMMDEVTVQMVKDYIRQAKPKILDLTGGAPEMNPHFKSLVQMARAEGLEVIDRCNLTILLEPGFGEMAQFLADNQVTVTASLPCYMEENVSKQRGKGVYDKSIKAIKMLNTLGYGKSETLRLNLVYNPVGAHLPPPQQALEADYKAFLNDQFDISFNELFTITNMPISRFGSVLASQGEFDTYMDLLKENYAASNLNDVMCRSLISLDWQGYVYDCDFNQMLELPLQLPLHQFSQQLSQQPLQSGIDAGAGEALIARESSRRHIEDLIGINLQNNPIVVAEHCYGCTAGQGSSCGGQLADDKPQRAVG